MGWAGGMVSCIEERAAVEVGERLGSVIWEIGFVGPEAWGRRFGEGGGSILAHSAFWAGVGADEAPAEVVGGGCWLDWLETASLRRGCRVAATAAF